MEPSPAPAPYSHIATAEALTSASVQASWAAVTSVGGPGGWGRATWLWQLRGALDRAVGGPGMRGAHPHPHAIRPGDALDWWRVHEVEPGVRLGLVAEMRLPGAAALDLELLPAVGGTRVRVTARFRPRGLAGLVYWYALAPAHRVVFPDLARDIATRAARLATTEA